MSITKVRQQRLHTLDDGLHGSFKSYLEAKQYREQDRAYILDVGVGMTESVNDEFSRLSFPYNKAINGYATVIIPSEQIMKSGDYGKFGEELCDIDIGDKYRKYTMKYKDMSGDMREELVATKYIERYLNYTAIAYQTGYDEGTFYEGNAIDKLLSKASDELERKEMDIALSCPISTYDSNFDKYYTPMKDKWGHMVTGSGDFDYDSFRQNVLSKYDNFVQADDIPVERNVVTGLSASNKGIYLKSYAAGINDKCKSNLMKMCYSLYPPKKDSEEYNNILKNKLFTESDYRSFVSNNASFCRYFSVPKDTSRSSDGFMMIPDSMDNDLPFF